MKLECGCYVDSEGRSIGKCAAHNGKAHLMLGDKFRWTGFGGMADRKKKLSALYAYNARMSQPMRPCLHDGKVHNHRQSEGGP